MLLFRPDFRRTCQECMTYLYDDDGNIRMRGTMKCRRPQGAAFMTPCQSCPKIPKSEQVKHWSNAVELSRKNFEAFLHWKGCKAVGRFPDDPIVERNAVVIQDVVNDWERSKIEDLVTVLATTRANPDGRGAEKPGD